MLTTSKFIEIYQLKALSNLAEAQVCLETQQPRAAISRAYYALYQAANAWIVHAGGDAAFDPDRPNRTHDDVDNRWRGLLSDVHSATGLESDFDGDTIYGRLKSLRVRVDYKPRLDPTMNDAESAVSASVRAVHWLLKALTKVGR